MLLFFFTATRDVMKEVAESWDDMPDANKEFFYKARKAQGQVMILCCVMTCCLIFTVAKLIASAYCKHAMWNLTDVFSESYGCLDLSSLAPQISLNPC